MPHFYFHVRAAVLIQDTEGTQLSGPDAAREEAVNSALEIITDGVRAHESRLHWSIEVADEAGQIIFVVPFAAALSGPKPATLAA
jgi:hypothetical protein